MGIQTGIKITTIPNITTAIHNTATTIMAATRMATTTTTTTALGVGTAEGDIESRVTWYFIHSSMHIC